jgi:hypothetical protein
VLVSLEAGERRYLISPFKEDAISRLRYPYEVLRVTETSVSLIRLHQSLLAVLP